jgi:hypothetical protein
LANIPGRDLLIVGVGEVAFGVAAADHDDRDGSQLWVGLHHRQHFVNRPPEQAEVEKDDVAGIGTATR